MCSFAVTSHATQFTGQFPNLIYQTFIFAKTSETRFILVGALRNQKPSGETSLSWASQFRPQIYCGIRQKDCLVFTNQF